MRQFKIALMGAGGVGKTSMIKQYVENSFEEMYEPTIEEIYRKTVTCDGEQFILEIVDTAGMEQFTQMRDLYIRKGDGFILVYSIIDPTTFEDVKSIREQIVLSKISEQVPIVLVGNKRDLAEDGRLVEKSEAVQLSAKWPHCKFIETSAMEHTEIHAVFEHALRTIISFESQRKSRVDALHKEAAQKRKSQANGKCDVM